MSVFFQVFYALFSGILTSLAIPNEIFYFGSPFFGIFALVPLYIAVKEAKSYKKAALLFAIDALTTHLLSSFWLANFKDFAIFTLGASAIGTACIEAMAGCMFFAPFCLGNSRQLAEISSQLAVGSWKLEVGSWKKSVVGGKLNTTVGEVLEPPPFRQAQRTAMSTFNSQLSTLNFQLSTFNSQLSTVNFRVFWFACVRVVYEWAKSTGFLAYPWGTLYMSSFRSKILMQSADIFGVYGITFLFAFLAGTVAELIIDNGELKISHVTEVRNQTVIGRHTLNSQLSTLNSQLLHCSLALILCFVIYGAFRLCQSRPVVKTMNAVLVQQNRDPWADKDDIKTMNISMELSQKGIDEFAANGITPDIVVWSEAVLRHRFPDSYSYYTVRPKDEPLVKFIQKNQIPFLIGGSYLLDEEKRDAANAALMFDKDGLLCGYYGKTHLVPFAEAVPGVEYPIIKKFLDKVVGFSNGWHPGEEFTLFDLKINSPQKKIFPTFNIIDMENFSAKKFDSKTKVRIATPICFEDAFPDICGPFHSAGAELFLNITDDSWSLTKSAEYQHFVVAAFRAIEYRTTLVRSTNAGFTVVVDNCGRIKQSIPLFEENYMCAQIPIYKWQETVYSRYTNWFVHLILVFMAIVFAKTSYVIFATNKNIIPSKVEKSILQNGVTCKKRRNHQTLYEAVRAALQEINL